MSRVVEGGMASATADHWRWVDGDLDEWRRLDGAKVKLASSGVRGWNAFLPGKRWSIGYFREALYAKQAVDKRLPLETPA